MNVLNIKPDKLSDLREIHSNERISRDVLEYVSILGKRPGDYCTNEGLVEISQKLGNVNKYQSYLVHDERVKLLAYHKEGNEKIAREYLHKEDGKLFTEAINMEDPEPYPGLTSEKIATLNNEFERLKNEFKYNRRFFEIMLHVENMKSIENSSVLIKRRKVYFLAVSVFLHHIAQKFKRIMKLRF